MHILVTGGAGFIGSNYVRHVLETTDATITTLDSLTYAGNRDNLAGIDSDRHQFIEGDIRDRDLISELVDEANVVVNFAAESHVDRSIDGADPFVSTNVGGTCALLDAATETNLERFIQISTDEVYGEILDGEFTESDRLEPRNPYAATKASADLLAQSYYTTHDVPVIITRSSNNYGPRQHNEKLIPKLIQRAVAGKSLPLYGDGSNVREWIYVEDNCRAIETARKNGTVGEIYNIGSGDERTNIEVAQKILDIVDANENLIEFVSDRPGHDKRYALDCSKVQSLGWEPKWVFENGLEQTANYYVPV